VTRSGCRWIGALVVAHVLAGSATAHAEVVVEAGAPFTADELEAALAIRQAAPADVVVHVVSPSAIELETPGGALRIELGDARGVEAARLVALQWAALADVAAPAPVVLAPPGLIAPAPPPITATATPFTIGIAAGIGIGVSSTDLTLSSVSGDILWRHGHWLWGGGGTWLHGTTAAPFNGIANMDLGFARAEVGVAFGRFSLLVGPAVVAFHSLSDRLGVVAGAAASFNVELLHSGPWRVYVRGEFDDLLQDIDYPDPLVASPGLTASASLGVAWGRP
jgi:hypothetical protein